VRRSSLRIAGLLAGLLGSGLLAACGPPDSSRSPEELYPKYCARCHGADGKGDPRQVGLDPNLNLTTSKLVGKGAHLAIYNRIAQGYGPMPAFGHRLSPEEMNHLADYCLKLNPNSQSSSGIAGK
jgi:mono/diheme cytochrome c family protein